MYLHYITTGVMTSGYIIDENYSIYTNKYLQYCKIILFIILYSYD